MTDEPVVLMAAAPPAEHDSAPPWKVQDALAICAVWLGISFGLHYVVGDRFHPSPAFVVAVQLVMEFGIIGAALLVVRLRGGVVRRWLVGASSWLVEMGIGLAFAVPLLLLAGMVNGVIRYLFGPPEIGQRAALIIGQLPLLSRIVMALAGVMLAPMAEEMLFRGLMLSSLRARIGWCAAWLAQAALFAAVHRDSPQIAATLFIVGLGLGGMYLWRHTLVSSIALHAGFNTPGLVLLVSLVWINQHDPAQTWDEAEQPPGWWHSDWAKTLAPHLIPDQETAEKQWNVALTFGSRGPQLWKLEALAFQKVIDRFPDDTHYAALSLAGLQQIYLVHLHDPRRAVLVGRRLLDDYPDEREACAGATLATAQAYLDLGELDAALDAVERAESDFGDVPSTMETAQALRREIERRAAQGP